MRREVARAAVTAAWIGLVVFAIPLAAAVWLLLAFDEQGELERAALRAAVQVDPGYLAGAPVRLVSPEGEITLGLYDPGGRLRAGSGPATADLPTRRAQQGQVSQQNPPRSMVVAVPTVSGERITGVIRASSPITIVWRRAGIAWLLLAALGGGSLLAAVAVARRRARRLAAPLEALVAASQAIGQGDFTITVPPSGMDDLDRVAATQNDTARRLEDLLQRERQFSADASHQLRTPLAGLQLILETAGQDDTGRAAAVDEALVTTRRLRATVEDVLAAHRGRGRPGSPPGARTGLLELLQATGERWRAALDARVLTVLGDPATDGLPVHAVRVGQILDVLLDNAVQHGRGAVTIRARPLGSAVAVDVWDEGPGITAGTEMLFRRGEGSGHGIGLALARELAESLGGRLLLSQRLPPTFTLTLPELTPPEES